MSDRLAQMLIMQLQQVAPRGVAVDEQQPRHRQQAPVIERDFALAYQREPEEDVVVQA